VHGAICAAAGFLAAVLWFDLMFDVQVRDHDGPLPEEVTGSIRAYYRRVTTDAFPRNRLVAAVMVVLIVAIALQAIGDDAARWVTVVSLLASIAPITLAAARTVPMAVRLGAGASEPAEQAVIARRIYDDHRLCLASIAFLLAVQLLFV
jgi:hypothetical protein